MALTQMGIVISPDLRVELYLLSDGTVELVPGYGFTTVYDWNPEGITAIFDANGFSLQAKEDKEPQSYEYHTPYPYKSVEVLKGWLLQQNLQSPV